MNEPIYKTTLSVNPADCDMFGRLRPAAMLKLMQGVGWEHADKLGLGNDVVWSKGLLWIIGRTVVEVERLPGSDEPVELLTWAGKTRRIFLPRSFELRSASGERLIQAKSIYLLLDRELRKTVDPLHVSLPIPTPGEREELPDPASRVAFPESMDGHELRRARYTELDLNGHLNNTHYLSWCEDLLSTDYHKNHALRSLWVEYRKEVRPENEVELSYALRDDTLYVKGGDFFAAKIRY